MRKITAIRKNRRDSGVRGNLNGVNPHSKGLIFSRSSILRLEKDVPRAINNNLNIRHNANRIINFNN